MYKQAFFGSLLTSIGQPLTTLPFLSAFSPTVTGALALATLGAAGLYTAKNAFKMRQVLRQINRYNKQLENLSVKLSKPLQKSPSEIHSLLRGPIQTTKNFPSILGATAGAAVPMFLLSDTWQEKYNREKKRYEDSIRDIKLNKILLGD